MSFKGISLWAVFGLCSWSIGWLMRPVEEQLSVSALEKNPLELRELEAGLGTGVTFAALGGYRNIAANFVWISLYQDWRLENAEAVEVKMRLAISLNPDSVFLWLDGARIIANDMPVWEIGEKNREALDTTERGTQIRHRYAAKALAFLDLAPESLQRSEALIKERAVIAWQKGDDLPLAIELLGELVQRENCPYYLSRVYCELLVRNGQVAEALAFLSAHYDSLPDDDQQAMKPLVAQRIEALRLMLGEMGK